VEEIIEDEKHVEAKPPVKDEVKCKETVVHEMEELAENEDLIRDWLEESV